MNKKCQECGKNHAMSNGICLECADKATSGKQMTSEAGKMMQERFKKIRRR